MNLRDPKSQRIVIGVLVLAAAGYVYFGTSLLPFSYPVRKAKIAELEKEQERLSAEVEKARKVVGDLARLEAEYDRLHEQWLSAQELLPQEKEMPELLRQVTTAGSRAGVEFALFQPGTSVPHEFYADHPITVTVRGNYHQVGAFLGRLANMERIVNVSDLGLDQPNEKTTRKKTSTRKAKEGDNSSNQPVRSNNTVEAKFTLTAYTLLGGTTNETASTASNDTAPQQQAQQHAKKEVEHAQSN
jgi:type IV pilus assembly protein PilO